MILPALITRSTGRNPDPCGRDVEALVVGVRDAVANAMARERKVALPGLSAFATRTTISRAGRDCRIGMVVIVEAKRSIVLRPSEKMRRTSSEGTFSALQTQQPSRFVH
ncbi:hypothetical protein FF100_35750 [Methylobacterium terricola]|uniref:Uncharacterized protein n=1 Tax=Methylobacterium terricola TaxID=2583531 RepID=A0A5C4L604_9HYPH|nr:hypothetical protein FF100_35750 [Methylobacterium terricola]